MKTILTTALLLGIIIFSSCEKEVTITLNPEEEEQILDFITRVEDMRASEDRELSLVLSQFYNSRNSQVCDPANFDFISESDLVAYSEGLEFVSLSDIHNWYVDYGMILRESISDPYLLKDQMTPALVQTLEVILMEHEFEKSAEPRSLTSNSCSVDAFADFSYYAIMKANTYGVQTSEGGRTAGRAQLTGWGSSLHRTFSLLKRIKECK